MRGLAKQKTGIACLALFLGIAQYTAVLAKSDEAIRHEIKEQISNSRTLKDTNIQIYVEQRLVVMTGKVQLYEQKLLANRIAWTTSGVYEVDNELQVVPKLPLSDIAIEKKIKGIIKTSERFRAAAIKVNVSNGKVFLEGSFHGFSDPSILKHQVAEIEGVVDIKINATFLT